jgi:hypothetical protein
MRRLVPIVLISASAAACTSNAGESIIVLKNVAPSAGCTFTASESEGFVTHGLLDISAGVPYQFAAQMKSRILLSADPNGTGAGMTDIDAETIFLRAANVDLTFPNSAIDLSGIPAELTHFKTLFSAVLRPEQLIDAPFELIPSDLGKAILKINANPPNVEVQATFTVIGDLGGDSVSSQPFVFPITLGIGVTSNNLGMCPLPVGTTVRTGGVCSPAQDGITDCCTDPASMSAVCPATVLTM